MILKKLFRKNKIDIPFEFKTRTNDLYAALRHDITTCPHCDTDDPILINKLERHVEEKGIKVVFVHVMKCKNCSVERSFAMGGVWEKDF